MLFADVRGYTSLTESLPPSEVPLLLNRFYETASSALLHHDGLLAQIEGDNVMCLFVPGLAGKEYVRQAVLGACELRERVDFLQLGIGIASGEEFVGNVGGGGYKDFTAVGDVTNTAARLTAKADAGEIVVDAETYGAVADLFGDAERRALELKGKQQTVETFLIRSDGS